MLSKIRRVVRDRDASPHLPPDSEIIRCFENLGFRICDGGIVCPDSVFPPLGNTGGCPDNEVIPLHLFRYPPSCSSSDPSTTLPLEYIDLKPASGFSVLIDALTVSFNLRDDFDFEVPRLEHILEPFYRSLGFTFTTDKSLGCHHVVLEESERSHKHYSRNFDVVWYRPSPWPGLRVPVVLGWFRSDPRASGQHHCTLMLSGAACAATGISKGGEYNARLVEFLSRPNPALVHVPKITRADVAVDDWEGAGGVRADIKAYEDGGFTVRGKRPMPSIHGDAAFNLNPETAGAGSFGSSLTLGKRGSSAHYIRCYEKDNERRDNGDAFAGHGVFPAHRREVEFKNEGVTIPFDILLHPLAYWAGVNGYFAELAKTVAGALVEEYKLAKCSYAKAKPAAFVFSRKVLRAALAVGPLVRLLKAAGLYDWDVVNLLVGQDFMKSPDLSVELQEEIRRFASDLGEYGASAMLTGFWGRHLDIDGVPF